MPDQIANFWDVIKYAVEESLPPIVGDHPDRMNRILASLLCGKTECWASYNKNESSIRFEGIVLTKIIYDDASDTRNLLMYCLYGYEDVNKESWFEGVGILAKYAKSKKCSKITAYTEIPYMIDMAKMLGGEAKYTFVSFDINKSIKLLNELEQSNKGK